MQVPDDPLDKSLGDMHRHAARCVDKVSLHRWVPAVIHFFEGSSHVLGCLGSHPRQVLRLRPRRHPHQAIGVNLDGGRGSEQSRAPEWFDP
jgi:hypothetical protein